MNKLFKLHFRNLFIQKAFYICLTLFILTNFLPSLLLMNTPLGKNVNVMNEFINAVSGTNMIMTIFITIFSCLDFSENTLKNIIAKGYSKKSYIITKIITNIIAILFTILVSFIICNILFISRGFGYKGIYTMIIICGLIYLISTTIIFTCTSLIFEKLAPAIIVNILGPAFIQLILSAIDSLFKIRISKYFITNASFVLLGADQTQSNFNFLIIISIIYAVVFLLLTVIVFKRKEIK